MTTAYQAPWWRSFGPGAGGGLLRSVVSLAVLALLLLAMITSCVDGIERTLALDEQAAKRDMRVAAELLQQQQRQALAQAAADSF